MGLLSREQKRQNACDVGKERLGRGLRCLLCMQVLTPGESLFGDFVMLLDEELRMVLMFIIALLQSFCHVKSYFEDAIHGSTVYSIILRILELENSNPLILPA
jgi:hypothetical protein